MSGMIQELSRARCFSKSEQSMLGERENTMDLIRKSEKINTLVKEQVGYEIRLFLFYFFSTFMTRKFNGTQ